MLSWFDLELLVYSLVADGTVCFFCEYPCSELSAAVSVAIEGDGHCVPPVFVLMPPASLLGVGFYVCPRSLASRSTMLAVKGAGEVLVVGIPRCGGKSVCLPPYRRTRRPSPM